MKVVLTGASRGIGKEIRDRLIENGHTVLTIGRDVLCDYECDLSDASQVTSAAEKLSSDHPDISILINNAGQVSAGEINDRCPSQIAYLMQVNLTAPMQLVAGLWNVLSSQPLPKIINISSISALLGKSAYACADYVASKYGLRGFLSHYRETEEGSIVPMYNIYPGPTDTDMCDHIDDKKTLLHPDEVADAVAGILGAMYTSSEISITRTHGVKQVW